MNLVPSNMEVGFLIFKIIVHISAHFFCITFVTTYGRKMKKLMVPLTIQKHRKCGNMNRITIAFIIVWIKFINPINK